MERNIRLVEPVMPTQPKAKRVAAYARVSSGKDAMLHSLSAQISYYSDMIQEHCGWQYCGVFADEAMTGTKENRPGFQHLLDECRAGNIDLIITKSISRFSRNTVTLLQTVRELKLLGVDVFFEEQHIHTMSADGELMMTLLASFAQAESLSASENQKWRIKKNFESGIPWDGTLLGYRLVDGQYVIVPEEAAIVRRIFSEYLAGYGYEAIATHLNKDGLRTRFGSTFWHSSIDTILHNYTYTGNLILQKTYRDNHITKHRLMNNGEYTKYLVEGAHEPIVSIEEFEQAQKISDERAEHFKCAHSFKTYPFSGKMRCLCCGKNYRRKTTKSRIVWICGTFNRYGKSACPTSKQIPEETLYDVCCELLGLKAFDEQIFADRVNEIRVGENNKLFFEMTDGQVIETIWKDISRAESWTPEKKETARLHGKRRHIKK